MFFIPGGPHIAFDPTAEFSNTRLVKLQCKADQIAHIPTPLSLLGSCCQLLVTWSGQWLLPSSGQSTMRFMGKSKVSLDFISSLCVILALLAKDFCTLILLLGFPADCSANSTVLEIRCLQSACPTAESCFSSNLQ